MPFRVAQFEQVFDPATVRALLDAGVDDLLDRRACSEPLQQLVVRTSTGDASSATGGWGSELWPAIGRWVESQTVTGMLLGWALVTVVMTGATWLVLRRAAP